METNIQHANESIKLLYRKECFLDGIEEIINVNDNEFCGKLNGNQIIIKGNNIRINKLDLEKKYVQLSGTIVEIKFTNNVASKFKNFFRK